MSKLLWVLPHCKKESAGKLVSVDNILAWGRGEIELTREEMTLLANPPLSAKGQENADQLCAKFIEDHGVPPVLFVSDRLRAMQTARVLTDAMTARYGHGTNIIILRTLGQGDSGDAVEGFNTQHPAYNAKYSMVTFAVDGRESNALEWGSSARLAILSMQGVIKSLAEGVSRGLWNTVIPVICHRPTAAALKLFDKIGYNGMFMEDAGDPGGPMDPLAQDLMGGLYYSETLLNLPTREIGM